MIIARLTLLAIILIFPSSYSYAEDGLDNYTPPPMFGAPRPVPPKKAKPDVPTMPKLSVPAQDKAAPVKEVPKPTPKKVVKEAPPKTAPKKIEPFKKPAPKKEAKPVKKQAPKTEPKLAKPIPKVPEIGTVEKPTVNQGIEPIDLIKKEKAVVNSKPKSEGVVKGPKTMPANKKQSVDTEVIFEDKGQEPVDILQRVQEDEAQKDQKQNAETAKAVVSDKAFPLPSFSVMADGERKLNIIFGEKQSFLGAEQKYSLDKLIIPLLKEEPHLRLNLQSFASPQDGMISADRRIALSRAMAVRKHIMAQGIKPNRLDVRSLGAQTDVQPMDRIEIYLIK